MRRGLVVVLTFVAVGCCNTIWLRAVDPPANQIEEATGVLMRSKLTSSQKVLEGLLRKDFDSIARGAREMKRISEAAEWPRARDSVYEHFSVEFRRQCNQLEALAEAGSQEGVSFTYLHLTSTCINCHDYVRDALRVSERGYDGNLRLIPSQWPEPDVNSHR